MYFAKSLAVQQFCRSEQWPFVEGLTLKQNPTQEKTTTPVFFFFLFQTFKVVANSKH